MISISDFDNQRAFNRSLTDFRLFLNKITDNFVVMRSAGLFLFIFFLGVNVQLLAQENYNSLIYKGNKAFDRKDYADASAKYLSAIKQNDKDFTTHYNLGNALYKEKKYPEAAAEFNKAQQLAQNVNDKAAALYNLGNTHMQQNNTKKAAELYKSALKQNPYNETVRRNYEIAMRKEEEKQNKQNQGKNGGGGKSGDEKEQNQSKEGEGKNKQTAGGKGERDKGEGKQGNPTGEEQNNAGKISKEKENALLYSTQSKERETARKILNRNSYSVPQSNEKDW